MPCNNELVVPNMEVARFEDIEAEFLARVSRTGPTQRFVRLIQYGESHDGCDDF